MIIIQMISRYRIKIYVDKMIKNIFNKFQIERVIKFVQY